MFLKAVNKSQNLKFMFISSHHHLFLSAFLNFVFLLRLDRSISVTCLMTSSWLLIPSKTFRHFSSENAVYYKQSSYMYLISASKRLYISSFCSMPSEFLYYHFQHNKVLPMQTNQNRRKHSEHKTKCFIYMREHFNACRFPDWSGVFSRGIFENNVFQEDIPCYGTQSSLSYRHWKKFYYTTN